MQPSTQKLLGLVNEVFPSVPKPEGPALCAHQHGCPHCNYLSKALEPYCLPDLSQEALSVVHREMTCLSAAGWRWVMPSYLRRCIDMPDGFVAPEAEFLIYNLGPGEKFRQETAERLSALNGAQIRCLIKFIEWCSEHETWGAECRAEIGEAREFLGSLAAQS